MPTPTATTAIQLPAPVTTTTRVLSPAYGGVRIQGAPHQAQVFVDGYYVGVVDDFDGAFQQLNLEAGAHELEIRIPGRAPSSYDVNVQPGQTMTIHAGFQ